MNTDEFLQQMDAGQPALPSSELAETMNELSAEAIVLCLELNTRRTTKAERMATMRQLTGREVPDSFRFFPPFIADCGKNIRLGERIFIITGYRFQDQGDHCRAGRPHRRGARTTDPHTRRRSGFADISLTNRDRPKQFT